MILFRKIKKQECRLQLSFWFYSIAFRFYDKNGESKEINYDYSYIQQDWF